MVRSRRLPKTPLFLALVPTLTAVTAQPVTAQPVTAQPAAAPPADRAGRGHDRPADPSSSMPG
ncbi:hypothetical protein FHX41_4638 [Actinomadura hallensis]|uniref:Uncharacterized protein n=1 Tax=Actinomadura hallensis TaxID=337895 RepID=A0A543IJY5_9ACTN|nr:hypothetical protein [Actinomadura hallensis]TQM70893.1 hypothetical protein FHX41_4638 [Actinomadura hallensis]